METLMRKMQENRKNNKGFTLVELIIVIAIIAVLAAVLAPQYIKYVENSRIATDQNALSEIAHAAEIEAVTVGDGTVAVKIETDGDFTYTANTLANAVKVIVPENSYKFTSKLYTTTSKTYSCVVTGGVAGAWTPPSP